MGAVGLLMMGAGTLMSAWGQYQQGQAGMSAANLQASSNDEIAKMNAAAQEKQAQQAISMARIRELRHRENTAKFIGSQKVAFAKSGVQLDNGSPLDVISDTAFRSEQDADLIKYEGEIQAWQTRTGASLNLTSSMIDSSQTRLMGRQTARAGTMGATTSLLTGGANMISSADKLGYFKKRKK